MAQTATDEREPARAATASASSRARSEDVGEDSARPSYDLTVEQLAAEVGMSVRNIRNHHTRGLLPPPEVRARVGYYSAEHVARLRLILDLQADGFNLAAIERLLSGSDGLAERLLGLRKAVTTPFEPEPPELITREELDQRFGELERQGRRAGAQAASCSCRSATIASKCRARRCCAPPSRSSRWASRCTRRSCSSSASAATATRSHATSPSCSCASCGSRSTQAGQPDEGWDELIEGVDSLRPLASRRCWRCSSCA